MNYYEEMDDEENNKQYYYKKLNNFKKALIKQLYQDLYKLNQDLFIKENITYEFFLYEFYSIIDQNINFDKPDYQGLVDTLNDIVKKKVLINKQNRELNDNIEDLYQNAEWELIDKYKSSLDLEKKLEEKKAKIEKMKKYKDELTKQIELNKKLKKINVIDENKPKLEKQDKYLLDEKTAKKELQEMKIKEIEEKEKENNKVNGEEEIDYSQLKGKDKDDIITDMVNKIMKKKRAEKIDTLLNGIKSKYIYDEKEFIMSEIKYEQKKVDEILEKEMLKYQDI